MGFFAELFPLIDGLPVTMRVMRTGDKITVGMLPDEIKGLDMLQVVGTPEELDAEFIKTVSQPLTDTKTQMSNVAAYGASLQKVVKEKMDDAGKGKKAKDDDDDDDKPATPKKSQGKSKPPVKKAAPPKKAVVGKKDVAAAKSTIKKLVGKKNVKPEAGEAELDEEIATAEVAHTEEFKEAPEVKGPAIIPFL
jgi:PRTRC genetic system protein E